MIFSIAIIQIVQSQISYSENQNFRFPYQGTCDRRQGIVSKAMPKLHWVFVLSGECRVPVTSQSEIIMIRMAVPKLGLKVYNST